MGKTLKLTHGYTLMTLYFVKKYGSVVYVVVSNVDCNIPEKTVLKFQWALAVHHAYRNKNRAPYQQQR